jgi:hypothetical protein
MMRRASLPVPVRPLRHRLVVPLHHHELQRQVHQQEVLRQEALPREALPRVVLPRVVLQQPQRLRLLLLRHRLRRLHRGRSATIRRSPFCRLVFSASGHSYPPVRQGFSEHRAQQMPAIAPIWEV